LIRLKDKGVLHFIEGKVASFDSVAVAEDFAEDGSGAGGKLVVFGSLFQGREDFSLSEGAGWDSGADGVKVHDGLEGRSYSALQELSPESFGWWVRGVYEAGKEFGYSRHLGLGASLYERE
jgi:hypothetical protein